MRNKNKKDKLIWGIELFEVRKNEKIAIYKEHFGNPIKLRKGYEVICEALVYQDGVKI